MFAFAGAEHQLADGFAGVLAFFENEFHLLCNGHLDAVLAGEFEGGAGGEDAFSYLSAETLEDFGKLAPLAECVTHGAVAREGAGAGEHQIADAAETGKSYAMAAAGDSETGDLRNAAGDERSGGIMSEAHADCDAGGYGDYVFERAAEFYADHITGGVDAQRFRTEFLLDELCDL